MPQPDPAELVARRRAAIAVFRRAHIVLDDDAALDAELLEIANKSGGSLVRVLLHGAEPPFSALSHNLVLVSALREALGYTGTPVGSELMTTAMAASAERPEICPDCQELGLCDHNCPTGNAKGWPRETPPADAEVPSA